MKRHPATRPFGDIWPTLGAGIYIDPSATVIGDVHLGDDVSVWPGAVIRGDVQPIRIGPASNVQDGAVLHCTHSGPFNPDGFALTIGAGVIVGHGAVVHGCTINDRVLIGNRAVVNDGAVLQSDLILGSGAVVSPGKTLDGGAVYVGAPAKPLRPLSDSERKFLPYSANHYITLKDKYLNA